MSPSLATDGEREKSFLCPLLTDQAQAASQHCTHTDTPPAFHSVLTQCPGKADRILSAARWSPHIYLGFNFERIWNVSDVV